MLIRLVEHCHSHGVFCLHKTGFMNNIYSKDTPFINKSMTNLSDCSFVLDTS